MNNSILKLVLLLFTIVTVPSCSKSDDAKQTPAPLPIATENVWKLDNYNYFRRVSTQTYSSYGNFTIINIDSNIASANSPYTNCNLIITFNTSSVGNYIIKTQNTTLTEPNQKYMHIRCQITSGNGTAAVYDSADGNVMASVIKEDDKFVVTIPSNAVLSRSSNDGMVNPPSRFDLTAQKVR